MTRSANLSLENIQNQLVEILPQMLDEFAALQRKSRLQSDDRQDEWVWSFASVPRSPRLSMSVGVAATTQKKRTKV
jgi:hypothetical protein